MSAPPRSVGFGSSTSFLTDIVKKIVNERSIYPVVIMRAIISFTVMKIPAKRAHFAEIIAHACHAADTLLRSAAR
jgi:hypothetical protein